MSFKEWLYEQLINDEVIDEDDLELEDLDTDAIISLTPYEEADIENFMHQFEYYCTGIGEAPIFDLD